MKLQLLVYKEKFKITDKDKEDYLRWYWLPEPEENTKEGIEARLNKLRLQVNWIRKITKKYNKKFFSECETWRINFTTNEITMF